jgi:hypothetical protein
MAKGLAGVRRQRPPTREMEFLDRPTMSRDAQGQTSFAGGLSTGGQVQNLGGGKFGVTSAPGSYGETSSKFYDDPTINEIVKLPSLAQAAAYTGTKPTFHGVQRPGDFQRVVQRQMANDMTGGQANQMIENRTENAKALSGDLSPNLFALGRMMATPPPMQDFTTEPPSRRPGRGRWP